MIYLLLYLALGLALAVAGMVVWRETPLVQRLLTVAVLWLFWPLMTTWWILLIVFGILGLNLLRKYFLATIKYFEVWMMFICIIIAAVAAGIIWG